VAAPRATARCPRDCRRDAGATLEQIEDHLEADSRGKPCWRRLCAWKSDHPFASNGASEGERLYSPPLNHGDLCGGEGPRYKGFMGLRMTFAGWLVMGAVVVCAQSKPAVRAAKPTPHSSVQSAKPGTNARLLDESDGLAVLGAALETRHKSAQSSDCSHLVHAIYEKAGFSYKYQSSRDLYAGDNDFQRVWQPQAGDLIVWPGHAGIVVNPAQHSFYSALRSGFGVQPYDSVYWRGRGRPRFFRYIKARPSQVLAARRVAGLKPAGLSSSERGRSAVDAASVDSDESNDASVALAETTSALTPVSPTVRFSRPKAELIKAALVEHYQSPAETSSSRPQLDVSQPVAAFDRFDVQKIHVKGDIGWTQIHFHGLVGLNARDARSAKPRDTQRFMMRRDGSDGWELILPGDTAYWPRDVAVKMLAHQLASLADSGSAGKPEQKLLLARWLNTLLDRR
jgi:hypothetical protein